MSKLTRKELDAVEELLCTRWPVFVRYQQRRRPLKIGIYDDLIAALGDSVPPQHLRIALRRYVCSYGYLRQMRSDAARFDLDGNKAGVVSAQHAADAKERLKLVMQRRKTSKKSAPAQVPAAKPRDGLAALRAAGRARKTIDGSTEARAR